MNKPVQEILDTCREMVFDGNDYLEIKKYLETLKLDSESQKLLLLKTDEMLVEHQLYQQHKTRSITFMLAGGLIMLIGAAISIGSYLMDKGQYVITVGLILVGAWALKRGYEDYRLTPEQALQTPKAKKGKFDRYSGPE